MRNAVEPREEKIPVTVKLRRQQLAVIDRVAKHSELNRSSLVRQIIAMWVKTQEEKA